MYGSVEDQRSEKVIRITLKVNKINLTVIGIDLKVNQIDFSDWKKMIMQETKMVMQ